MNNTERYENLIINCLKALQLKHELEKALGDIASLLTVKELKSQWFDHDAVKRAFLLVGEVDGIEIKDASHVKSQITFKDIEVNLHCFKNDIGNGAMKHVLDQFTTSEILNA